MSLVFDGVHKAFDGQPVLQGFSAEVPLEGLTFVVGRSGSGKSVLCRATVGLVRIDAGTIHHGPKRVDDLPERSLNDLRRRLPYLVQSPALLDWLSLEENVALAGGNAASVRLAMARVGLGPVAHKKPAEVGPGVRKRAAIARALMLEPEFLLLDEPTTGLDHDAAALVHETLRTLQREGLGALVVSHDHRAVRELADRVLEVHQGRQGYFGPARDFQGLTPLTTS